MDKAKVKHKNHPSEPHKDRNKFWGVWIFSQTIMLTYLWLLVGMYERISFPFHSFSTFLIGLVLTSVFTLAATTLQQTAGERFLKCSMRQWAFVSGLGTALSLLAYVIVHPMGLLPSALAMFMPTALAQMLWMRPRVFFAWLWPLAHLVGIVMFVETWLPLRDWATLLLAPIQAIIYTIVMRHLFARSYDTDKQKTEVAAKETFDQEPIERLEEHEANGTFEAFGDEQMTQSERR